MCSALINQSIDFFNQVVESNKLMLARGGGKLLTQLAAERAKQGRDDDEVEEGDDDDDEEADDEEDEQLDDDNDGDEDDDSYAHHEQTMRMLTARSALGWENDDFEDDDLGKSHKTPFAHIYAAPHLLHMPSPISPHSPPFPSLCHPVSPCVALCRPVSPFVTLCHPMSPCVHNSAVSISRADSEHMYSSPLDEIDEVVVFSRAMHAACQATPQLLPMLGLSAEQGGIAAAVPREESLALHAWLAEGVRKGMGGDVHAQQQMLAQAPWQGVLPLPGAGAGGGGAGVCFHPARGGRCWCSAASNAVLLSAASVREIQHVRDFGHVGLEVVGSAVSSATRTSATAARYIGIGFLIVIVI